jgi:hypothetical protein
VKDILRDYIGTAEIIRILHRMETTMTALDEKLAALETKLSAMGDAQRASFENLLRKIQEFKDAEGTLTVEQEARFAAIEAAVDEATANATAADDGYEPTPAEPENPNA